MIQVEHLTKYYGNVLAVNDLSFEIEEGGVYGFLGPNGAGKSTTMNIITGCLSLTDGKVSIGGFDIYEEPENAKKLIGYLPEQPPLYLNETPNEYLKFVAQVKGLKGEELTNQIEKAIEQTGLSHMRNRLISALSKGYKQRVGIAQALLGDPKVIILDEPTVGLDPLQIVEIRMLIKELGKTHTVILSSHILSEVQAICDKVLIITNGRLAAFDTPENLEKLFAGSLNITIKAMTSAVKIESVLSSVSDIAEYTISAIDDDAVKVNITSDAENDRALCCSIFNAFAAKNIPLFEMSTAKVSLEDVFIELAEKKSSDHKEVSEEDVLSGDEDMADEEDLDEEKTDEEVNE